MSPRRAGRRRLLRRVAIGVAAVAGVVAVVAVVTPWPAALLIRAVFDKGAADTLAEMERHEPASDVSESLDISYGAAGADTTLDVFTPGPSTNPDGRALPTVVWIHGGAWISGDKADVRPYVRMIAAEGFTTVSLNYTDSPAKAYPTSVEQLNEALGYLVEHADELGIDPDRLVLAGDSAGANLASQLATITTSPSYAAEVGIEPALTAGQIKGVVLNCGIYDVRGIPEAPGIAGWGFRVALWSYLGERDWSKTPGASQMSTVEWVTEDFPSAWISGGNADPLTDTQAKPLAERLTGLGVDVETVFYPADHKPELPHEYQFHLDYEDADTALTSTLEFLRRVTA